MSVSIVCHTGLITADLAERLKDIRNQYPTYFEEAFILSEATASEDFYTEILQDAGADFQSISWFSLSNRKGNNKLVLKDGVELLKKEFSDVDFAAMHLNEKLM
ncbi:hypothetical protein SAMN06265368_4879 [Cohaesibacter gelatinilyticus]|uniref:Uncharacterized protein n=1 Tax=Cohaesibacter gelatinilyticus TaxID=372072 RepID=A0A285PJ55_9HYPH|nr:hypothetical protein SAMN06265368_4879 [Cohaesibacter gelatinilyticus]